MESPLLMIGPWGGYGGTPRDIQKGLRPHHLQSITIRSTDSSGGRIDGFSFVYVDCKGQSRYVGTWGTYKGNVDTIIMEPGEHINNVAGSMDRKGITSLKFVTNTGVEYGPYGSISGLTFSVPLLQGNGEVISFFGRESDCLVALGVYATKRNAYNYA